MNHPKHYRHAEVYFDLETFGSLRSGPFVSMSLAVKVCRRKWRMVYGWRNNPAASAMHFQAAALFTDCAQRAAKIAERFPIFEAKRSEAQIKATLEISAGMAALVDKWVRVGSKHRWEVK